jgi:pimeloyl-ACP methyl ester carboxylesterase
MPETSITGTVRANGADFHYDLIGAPPHPPLVLLHAGICDRRMWDDQLPALAEHYRVLRYDLRGFGETGPAVGPYSHAADLAGVLTALGLERAHLLGCSKGGSTALDFALLHPERVSALVLVCSSPSGYRPDPPVPEPPQVPALVAAFDAGDLERCAELEVQIWVDGPTRAPSQVPAALRDKVRAMDLLALQHEVAGSGQEEKPVSPAASRLAEVRAPTLVMIADLDSPISLRSSEALAAGIPGAQRVVITGAAHLPNMEQPAVFNRAVLDFLRGL